MGFDFAMNGLCHPCVCWSPSLQCAYIWRDGACEEVIKVEWGHGRGEPHPTGSLIRRGRHPRAYLSVMWGHSEMGDVCKPGRGPSPENCACTLILGFQPPALWGVNVNPLSCPVCDTFITAPGLAETGFFSAVKPSLYRKSQVNPHYST